jgi:serine/threonine-protein kinase
MSTITEFQEKNAQDWKKILTSIFPIGIPDHAEWSDLNGIISILNRIGSVDSSNHIHLPTGGGLDVKRATLSHEDDSIEIITDGSTQIVKPVKLTFESFEDRPEWSYFRLEAIGVEQSEAYDYKIEGHEEVVEIAPAHYVAREHWDNKEYGGEPLPEGSRLVIRNRKGSFLIVQKSGPYNSDRSTYDARHNQMSDDVFKAYILQEIDAN